MPLPFNRHLRCLTLRQPWGSLLAGGLKRNETRGWQTNYRGLVAIHTSSTFSNEEMALCLRVPFADALRQLGFVGDDKLVDATLLPLGKFIAIGRLDAITPSAMYRIDSHHPKTRMEFAFGNYSYGRFVWHFNDVRPFQPEQFVPGRGQQSLWTPEEDLHQQLLEIFNSLASGGTGNERPDQLQL